MLNDEVGEGNRKSRLVVRKSKPHNSLYCFHFPRLLLGNQATRTCKKQEDVGVGDSNLMLLWLSGYACWTWAIVDIDDNNHKYEVITPKVVLAWPTC